MRGGKKEISGIITIKIDYGKEESSSGDGRRFFLRVRERRRRDVGKRKIRRVGERGRKDRREVWGRRVSGEGGGVRVEGCLLGRLCGIWRGMERRAFGKRFPRRGVFFALL